MEKKQIIVKLEFGRRAAKFAEKVNAALYGLGHRRIDAEQNAADNLLACLFKVFDGINAQNRERSPRPRDGESLGDFTARRIRAEIERLNVPPEHVWTAGTFWAPAAAA